MNLKEKLLSNLGWKIVALLLALVLWFHVATEKTYEKTFPAKIEIEGLKVGLQVQNIEPSSAAVSVIGTGKQILQLMLSGGPKAYLDLAFVSRPGQYEYSINTTNLRDLDPSAFRGVTFIGGNQFVITVKSRT